MQQHVQEGANIVPLASGEAERIMDHREMTHLHSNKLPNENEMLKSEIQLKNVNIAKGRKEAKYEYINCKCERLNEER